MKNVSSLRSVFTVMFLGITFWACGPKPQVGKTDKDDYGCKQPPPNVFTSAGVDIEFAKSTFGKVVVGDIKIKTDPQVVTLASKAATDDQILSYLRCLARNRDGFTNAQIAYLEQMNGFLRTNPSPEQFLEWQGKNPFPKN